MKLLLNIYVVYTLHIVKKKAYLNRISKLFLLLKLKTKYENTRDVNNFNTLNNVIYQNKMSFTEILLTIIRVTITKQN